MNISDNISYFCNAFANSIKSCAKILLLSKSYNRTPIIASSEELVILGNGPSLNDTLTDSLAFLKSRRLLAVNFAANTDMFCTLKPEFYVLADPHFFISQEQPNVSNLWDTLSKKVDWNITLFIPANIKRSGSWYDDIRSNTNINLVFYNTTAVEGFKWLENLCFSRGLGMPRPRNVLIPSLMIALRMRFKTIYLAGADHSWTRTISVNDNNEVVSIQPHFYKEEDTEKKRVNTEYMKYPLYKIMYSFYIAFKSYFTIKRYADKIGATIWNITPGSFIDAFPRKNI
ncbi:MAG: hypothetical protein RR061_07925 [Muribaculaceae bacterium]